MSKSDTEVTTSYKAKILGYNNIFKDTVRIYRRAVAFFADVVNSEWLAISQENRYRLSFVESLTLATKQHPFPKYNFKANLEMPAYLRRAAINSALGLVSSYKTNLEIWEKSKKDDNPPRLEVDTNLMPTFYMSNMYKEIDATHVKLKILHQKKWTWLDMQLKKSDIDYFETHCSNMKKSCPTLNNIGKEWYLTYAFTEKVTPNKTKLKDTRAIGVDLGINNAATCCAMSYTGAIIGRKVISFPVEKDILKKRIGRKRRAQKNGARSTPKEWALINHSSKEIIHKTVNCVIEFALLCNADVIVLEHLDTKGKKRGPNSELLNLWPHAQFQEVLELHAKKNGMIVSRVIANGTSSLAFDGSGKVKRGEYYIRGEKKYNYSICTFTTGKQYNCDLNASYNIAARYFIEEILKSLPETERLAVKAKVPQLAKRTTCTLSSLINLNAVCTV